MPNTANDMHAKLPADLAALIDARHHEAPELTELERLDQLAAQLATYRAACERYSKDMDIHVNAMRARQVAGEDTSAAGVRARLFGHVQESATA